MTNPIDILIIEPADSDARKTLAAVRRKAPDLSSVHVSGAEVAAGLIFDYWPSEHPQVPRLIIVDLPATGEPGTLLLHRLRSAALTRNVATVNFSARAAPPDAMASSLCGAMNVLKPMDSDEYDLEVERVTAKLLLERA